MKILVIFFGSGKWIFKLVVMLEMIRNMVIDENKGRDVMFEGWRLETRI